jgi:hypothetical protein
MKELGEMETNDWGVTLRTVDLGYSAIRDDPRPKALATKFDCAINFMLA